jgi:hypothetical protein
MTPKAMKLWGRRVLRPAAKAVTGGREDVTLYTLRHTHASACHLDGLIAAARADVELHHGYMSASAGTSWRPERKKTAVCSGSRKPSVGLEPTTPSLPWQSGHTPPAGY